MSTSPFSWPFDDWLRAGVASGLSPAEVWATSLRDLYALTASQPTLDRAALDALCQLFPDGPKKEERDG